MAKYAVPIPTFGWQSENMAPAGSGQLEMSYSATVVTQELEDGTTLVVPLRKYPQGVALDRADRDGPALYREGEMVARVNPADIALFRA